MMKPICVILFWGCLLLSLQVAAKEQADSLLTEQVIRKYYVNHPDSCLHLLDRAEGRLLPTDIAPWRIDQLRAMCHEIKGDYAAKEVCVRRALQNDSVRLITDRRLTLTVMLAGVLERQNKYEECIGACREAVDMARTVGRKKDEAEMFSTLARIYMGMKENGEALKSFEQAVELLEGTEDVREMSYLSTIYGEYMTALITLEQNRKAIEIGGKREAVIARMSRMQGPPPGYIDQQYGFLYAKMAVLLLKEGRGQEAEDTYVKYSKLRFAQTLNGKLFSIPYLLDAGRYGEALEQNDACLAAFTNDTIGYEYLQLLEQGARASRGMKRYDRADAYMQRCFALQDSIYAREKEGKAQEYAHLFRTKEQEMKLLEARAVSERKTILIAASCLVILILGILLRVIWRNLSKTQQRNRIAARQIDELMKQREELRRTFTQMKEAKEQAEAAKKAAEEAKREAEEQKKEAVEQKKAADLPGYDTFMRMETILVEKKLFLQPKFSRDELLRITGVGKNELVSLLRTHADSDNLNDYLNRLRAEHAIRMIKENPHLTLDAIAEASGFNSRSTFYRFFVKTWGMTPTQYIQTLQEE